MEKVLTNFIIGSVVACVFGVVAYLMKRLVDQNDDFQEETRRGFREIRREFDQQRIAANNLQFSLEKKLEAAGLDTKTKAKMSSLLAMVSQVEKDLTQIKPALEQAHESSGKIIWIVDKLEAQDKKLKGLYDVMIKIVRSQKH